MADAQFRATQAAIPDQEVAGIDIITGGEMHRRTNNRHAPSKAMLNFFRRAFGETPSCPHRSSQLPLEHLVQHRRQQCVEFGGRLCLALRYLRSVHKRSWIPDANTQRFKALGSFQYSRLVSEEVVTSCCKVAVKVVDIPNRVLAKSLIPKSRCSSSIIVSLTSTSYPQRL